MSQEEKGNGRLTVKKKDNEENQSFPDVTTVVEDSDFIETLGPG